jgi:hypothetical protein
VDGHGRPASHNFDNLFIYYENIQRKPNTIIMNIYTYFSSKTRRRAACYCIKMEMVQTPPNKRNHNKKIKENTEYSTGN